MSLLQTARMRGRDPFAYLRHVRARLPTQRASQKFERRQHCDHLVSNWQTLSHTARGLKRIALELQRPFELPADLL